MDSDQTDQNVSAQTWLDRRKTLSPFKNYDCDAFDVSKKEYEYNPLTTWPGGGVPDHVPIHTKKRNLDKKERAWTSESIKKSNEGHFGHWVVVWKYSASTSSSWTLPLVRTWTSHQNNKAWS